MRIKFNFFFLLIISFSLLSFILLPYFLRTKTSLIEESKDDKFENKFILDAINPSCLEDGSYKKFDLKTIEISIPSSRRWSINLLKAKTSRPRNIVKKYKKKFNANIILKKSDNVSCVFPAKIRLSGDWKDHIKHNAGLNYIASSMDVQLLEGNINGIIKFKLFIPRTRNGLSEIIATSLLKSQGYIAPLTSFVEADVNGTKLKMLFQEKASKELIESNKFRESAILEVDESLLWQMRSISEAIRLNLSLNESENMADILFPKVTNKNWLKKDINYKVALKGMNILSSAILEMQGFPKNKSDSFSDTILANFNNEYKKNLSKYRTLLISMGSYHGLINHNRKFYFDTLNNSLIPIYYDGNAKINHKKKFDIDLVLSSIKEDNHLREVEEENINETIKDIKSINRDNLLTIINNSGITLNLKDIDFIIENVVNNLEILKNHIGYTNLKEKSQPLKSYKKGNIIYGLAYYLDDYKLKLCNLNTLKCKTKIISNVDLYDLIRGNYSHEKINYYFVNHKKNSLSRKSLLKLVIPNSQINLYTLGLPNINIDRENKLIKILINKDNQKVLISKSYLNEWKIKIDSKIYSNEKKTNFRQDENLLTGLLTINESKMNDIEIHIKGGIYEDSVNILRSKGSIKLIKVIDSQSDAVDIDFSNLNIKDIQVKNSGNDCIDFSSGYYFIKNANLTNCTDKGISLGEKSNLTVDTIKIYNSKIGLVAKDSSKLLVKSGKLSNTDICLAAYRKKQEFNGGIITVPTKLCNGKKILIQKNSFYKNYEAKN